MTSSPYTRKATLPAGMRQLLETDRKERTEFLKRAPEENLYLLSRIAMDGVVNEASPAHGRFYGHFGSGGLNGVAFFGHRRGIVLAGSGEPFVRASADLALGPEGDWVLLVCPRTVGEGFLSHYRWRGRPAHLNRVQDYYVARTPDPEPPAPGFRLAEPADLETVTEMSDRMLLEDLDLPAGCLSRDGIRESMRQKIADGRTWVIEEGGEIVFKVDVSAHFAGGSQLEGVYTQPFCRGQGHATRGMKAATTELLKTSPFVTLHVNSENYAAKRVYEKAGYRYHSEFLLVLLQMTR